MSQQRTVFTLSSVLSRSEHTASPITAIALDHDALRLYLARHDGSLEEYKIKHHHLNQQQPSLSLTAKKHLFKKPTSYSSSSSSSLHIITHLLSIPGGLLAISSDASASLIDAATLQPKPLPQAKHVTAADIIWGHQGHNNNAPLLALATKPSKKTIRVLIYRLPLGHPVLPPTPIAQFDYTNNNNNEAAASVTRLAWIVYTPSGEYSMVLCCGLKYHLLTVLPDKRNNNNSSSSSSSSGKDKDSGVAYKSIWRELFEVPLELAYCPPTVSSLPSLSLAMVTMGPVGVVINARGEPVGSSLHFDESSIPQTLSWGGGGSGTTTGGGNAYIVAASDRGGVDVYDYTTGHCVQHIDLALSQQLQLGRSSNNGGGGSSMSGRSGSGIDVPLLAGGGMISGRASSTGTVAIVSRHHENIWLCQPISIKEQVVTHLTHGDIDAALSIIEASLLLMNEIYEDEDVDVDDDYNNNNSSSKRDDSWVEEAYAQAGLMLLEKCDFDRALGVLERCRPAVFQPSHLFPLFPTCTAPWITDDDNSKSGNNSREYWKLHKYVGKLPSLDELLDEEEEEEKKSSGDVIKKQQRAAVVETIAQYLFRVRIRTGIACVEGIDTLLFYLFAELEAEEQATAFAALPNCANIELLQERLKDKGWWHALATLLAVQGSSEEALHVWKQVLVSSTAAMKDSTEDEDSEESKKRQRRRQEALDSTVRLLQTTITIAPKDDDDNLSSLLLRHLSWLFQVDVQSALRVVAAARSVPPQALLSDETALPPGSAARWQYLHYVITVQGSTDASLHTCLALELIDVVSNTVASHTEERKGEGENNNNQAMVAVFSKPRQQIPIHTNQGTTTNNKPAFSIKERYEATTTDQPPIITMRSVLLHHLETSPLYDAATVMNHLKKQTKDNTSSSSSFPSSTSTTLLFCEEKAAVCAKMGNHDAALILLALYLKDVAAAEAYARTHLPPDQHSKLLDLLLNPSSAVDSDTLSVIFAFDATTAAAATAATKNNSSVLIQREPLWEDACWLISILGDTVDALALLQSLPPSMPLTTAESIIIPMLQDRIHRKRMSQMMRAMHTAKLNSVMLTKVKAERNIDNNTDGGSNINRGGVVVDDDKACMECHLRLGGRVFVVLPVRNNTEEEEEMEVKRGGGKGGEEEKEEEGHGHHGGGRRRVVCFSCYQRQTAV